MEVALHVEALNELLSIRPKRQVDYFCVVPSHDFFDRGGETIFKILLGFKHENWSIETDNRRKQMQIVYISSIRLKNRRMVNLKVTSPKEVNNTTAYRPTAHMSPRTNSVIQSHIDTFDTQALFLINVHFFTVVRYSLRYFK